MNQTEPSVTLNDRLKGDIQPPTDPSPDKSGMFGGNTSFGLLTSTLTSQGWTDSICQFFVVGAGATQTFYFWIPKWVKQIVKLEININPWLGSWDIAIDGGLVQAAVVVAAQIDATSKVINNVLSQPGGRHPILGMHTLTAKNLHGGAETVSLQLAWYVISQPSEGAPANT